MHDFNYNAITVALDNVGLLDKVVGIVQRDPATYYFAVEPSAPDGVLVDAVSDARVLTTILWSVQSSAMYALLREAKREDVPVADAVERARQEEEERDFGFGIDDRFAEEKDDMYTAAEALHRVAVVRRIILWYSQHPGLGWVNKFDVTEKGVSDKGVATGGVKEVVLNRSMSQFFREELGRAAEDEQSADYIVAESGTKRRADLLVARQQYAVTQYKPAGDINEAREEFSSLLSTISPFKTDGRNNREIWVGRAGDKLLKKLFDLAQCAPSYKRDAKIESLLEAWPVMCYADSVGVHVRGITNSREHKLSVMKRDTDELTKEVEQVKYINAENALALKRLKAFEAREAAAAVAARIKEELNAFLARREAAVVTAVPAPVAEVAKDKATDIVAPDLPNKQVKGNMNIYVYGTTPMFRRDRQ